MPEHTQFIDVSSWCNVHREGGWLVLVRHAGADALAYAAHEPPAIDVLPVQDGVVTFAGAVLESVDLPAAR